MHTHGALASVRLPGCLHSACTGTPGAGEVCTRQDYRAMLGRLGLPTLIVSGRDVGAVGAGVGKAQPEQVDRYTP